MYDKASANMANRAKTAASGAPKKMNKREKRKMRAGLGGGSNSRPVTPANAAITSRSVIPAKTPKIGHWGGRTSDGEPHGPAEPTSTSLITQMAFRTVEHEVHSLPYATPPINSSNSTQIQCMQSGHASGTASRHFTSAAHLPYKPTWFSRQNLPRRIQNISKVRRP